MTDWLTTILIFLPMAAALVVWLLPLSRQAVASLATLVSLVEREYFTRLLVQYKGNVARCAQHSGLSRRSVTQKLQKYELDRTRFKDGSGQDWLPIF